MNKKFLVASLLVFVVWMAGGFVIHGMLLAPDYGQLPNLFRPEPEAAKFFPLMILAHVLMAVAFVWIYSRGVSAAPWVGQGLRFGLAVDLLTVVPTYMVYYVVQPMPGELVVKQIIFDGIQVFVLAFLVAFLYRQEARA
jgi:hypothetical protein